MARPLRVEYEGAIYHVTVRGNARRAIFLDDRDRQRFLARLADGVDAHDVRLYLFCLMTNHVHLMLETPGASRKLRTQLAAIEEAIDMEIG